MKIAIPTRGENVDSHFGHCNFYTLFLVDENRNILQSEILPAPQGCGCKSNIITILKEQGVTIMLAGNMGNGALEKLNNNDIEVIRGCSGKVNLVVENFLKDQLQDSGEGCHSHEHDAEYPCNH